jgi:hypothetical protein
MVVPFSIFASLFACPFPQIDFNGFVQLPAERPLLLTAVFLKLPFNLA